MLRKVVNVSKVWSLLGLSIAKDNEACTDNSENSALLEMSKHVDLKYRFITGNISKEHVKLHNVPSKSMVADLFAKSLLKNKFAQFTALLGIEWLWIDCSERSVAISNAGESQLKVAGCWAGAANWVRRRFVCVAKIGLSIYILSIQSTSPLSEHRVLRAWWKTT